MEQIKESVKKGKTIPGDLLGRLCQYALSTGAGFVLGGCSVNGQALPLGGSLVGAQPLGGCALGTAVGAVAGYFFRCDPAEAVEYSALTVLMLLTLLLFHGTGLTVRKWFMPMCCGAICCVLGAVRMIGSVDVTVPLWLGRALTGAIGTYAFRGALGGEKRGRVLLGAAVVLGLAGVGTHIDVGLMAAVMIACVSRELFPAAVMGMSLELSGLTPEYMTLALVLPGVFCKFLRIRRRETVALSYGVIAGTALFFLGSGQSPQYIGILAGAAGGYALSRSPLLHSSVTTSEDRSDGERLEQAAQVLEALGKALPDTEVAWHRETEKVFDAAAEQVCGKCAFFHRCWQTQSRETYEALSYASSGIMERGLAKIEDFPKSFQDRCCSIERLIFVINREMEGMLYRRRYYMHLWENRKVLEQEYDLLARFLRTSGKGRGEERRFAPKVSICSMGKDRKKVCGDRGACFMGQDNHYYVILCDGMGTGEEAARLSNHTLRLLEKLLRGGMEPVAALRLLNGNMLLRGSSTFSTVDLLKLDLYTGTAYIYKWGAVPSYWKDGDQLHIVGNPTPPPGVGLEDSSVPEQFKLSMKSGQLLVMISDGVYGEETEATIASYTATSTRELAALLVAGIKPEDDMTAIVISLGIRSS